MSSVYFDTSNGNQKGIVFPLFERANTGDDNDDIGVRCSFEVSNMHDPSNHVLKPYLFFETFSKLIENLGESFLLNRLQCEKLNKLLNFSFKLKTCEGDGVKIPLTPRDLLKALQEKGRVTLTGSRVDGILDLESEFNLKKDMDFKYSFNDEVMDPQKLFHETLVLIGRLIHTKANIANLLHHENKNFFIKKALAYIMRASDGQFYKTLTLEKGVGICFKLCVDLGCSVPIDISVFSSQAKNPFVSITKTRVIEEVLSDKPLCHSKINRELSEYLDSNRIIIIDPNAEGVCSFFIKLLCPGFKFFEGPLSVLQPGLVRGLFNKDSVENRKQFIANLLNPYMNIHTSSCVERILFLNLFRTTYKKNNIPESLKLYLRSFEEKFKSIEDENGKILSEKIKNEIVMFDSQKSDIAKQFHLEIVEDFLRDFDLMLSLKKAFPEANQNELNISKASIEKLLMQGFDKTLAIHAPYSKEVRMNMASLLVGDVSNKNLYEKYLDLYLPELFPLLGVNQLIDHWYINFVNRKKEKNNNMRKILFPLLEYYTKSKLEPELEYLILQSIYFYEKHELDALKSNIESFDLTYLSKQYCDLLYELSSKLPLESRIKVLIQKIKKNEREIESLDLKSLQNIFISGQNSLSEEKFNFYFEEVFDFLCSFEKKYQIEDFVKGIVKNEPSETLLRFLIVKLGSLLQSNKFLNKNFDSLKKTYIDCMFLLVIQKKATYQEVREVLGYYESQLDWPKYCFVLNTAVKLFSDKEEENKYYVGLFEKNKNAEFTVGNFNHKMKMTLEAACAFAEGILGFKEIKVSFLLELCENLNKSNNYELALDYLFEFLSMNQNNEKVLSAIVALSKNKKFNPEALSFKNQGLLYMYRPRFEVDIQIKILMQKLRQMDEDDKTNDLLNELFVLFNKKLDKRKKSDKRKELSSDILDGMKYLVLNNLNDDRFILCCEKVLDSLLNLDKKSFQLFLDELLDKSFISESLLRFLNAKYKKNNFIKDKDVRESINRFRASCIGKLVDTKNATPEEVIELVKLLKMQSKWLEAISVLTAANYIVGVTRFHKENYFFEKNNIYKKMLELDKISIEKILEHLHSCWHERNFDIAFSIYLSEKMCDQNQYSQALRHLIQLGAYSQDLTLVKDAILKITVQMKPEVDLSFNQCDFLKKIWEELSKKTKIMILVKKMENCSVSSGDLLKILNLMIDEDGSLAVDVSDENLKILKNVLLEIKPDQEIELCYKKMFIYLEQCNIEIYKIFVNDFLQGKNIDKKLIRFLIERLQSLKTSKMEGASSLLISCFERLKNMGWDNFDFTDMEALLCLYEDKKNWDKLFSLTKESMEIARHSKKEYLYQCKNRFLEMSERLLGLKNKNFIENTIAHVEDFLEIDNSSYAAFYLKLCQKLCDSGFLSEALIYLRKLEKNIDGFDLGHIEKLLSLLSFVYKKKGDEKSSISCLEKFCLIHPDNLDFSYNLHEAYLNYTDNKKYDYKDRVQYAEKHIELCKKLFFSFRLEPGFCLTILENYTVLYEKDIAKDLSSYFFSENLIQLGANVNTLENIFNLLKRRNYLFDSEFDFYGLLQKFLKKPEKNLNHVLKFVSNALSDKSDIDALVFFGDISMPSMDAQWALEYNGKHLKTFVVIKLMLISFFSVLEKYEYEPESRKKLSSELDYIVSALHEYVERLKKLYLSKKFALSKKELDFFLKLFRCFYAKIKTSSFLFSIDDFRKSLSKLFLHFHYVLEFGDHESVKINGSFYGFKDIARFFSSSLSFYIDNYSKSENMNHKKILDGFEELVTGCVMHWEKFLQKDIVKSNSTGAIERGFDEAFSLDIDYLLCDNEWNLLIEKDEVLNYSYSSCLFQLVCLSNVKLHLKSKVFLKMISSVSNFYLYSVEKYQSVEQGGELSKCLEKISNFEFDRSELGSIYKSHLSSSGYADKIISMIEASEKNKIISDIPKLYFYNMKFCLRFLCLFESDESILYLKVFSRFSLSFSKHNCLKNPGKDFLNSPIYDDYVSRIYTFINLGQEVFRKYFGDFKDKMNEFFKYKYQFNQLVFTFFVFQFSSIKSKGCNQLIIARIESLFYQSLVGLASFEKSINDLGFKKDCFGELVNRERDKKQYQQLFDFFLFLFAPIHMESIDRDENTVFFVDLLNAVDKETLISRLLPRIDMFLNCFFPESSDEYAKLFVSYANIINTNLAKSLNDFRGLSKEGRSEKIRDFIEKKVAKFFSKLEVKNYSKEFILEVKERYKLQLNNLTKPIYPLVSEEILKQAGKIGGWFGPDIV